MTNKAEHKTIKESTAYQVEGVEALLKAMPPEEVAAYGFESAAQVEDARLEEPFQLYTVNPQALQERAESEIAVMTTATSTWYFPLSAGGKVRSLLITQREGDTYRAVGIGRAKLARELGQARAHWPTTRGHHLKVVNVLGAASQAEFVLSEGKDAPALVPLESGRRVLGETGERSAAPRAFAWHEILSRLKAAPQHEHLMHPRFVQLKGQAAQPAAPAEIPPNTIPMAAAVSIQVSELPDRQQLSGNWCWATMVQANLARHDIVLDQCYLVQWALDEAGPNSNNACGNPAGSDYSETGVGSHEMQLNWGVPGSIVPRALSWSEIKNEINSGNPIVRYIAWEGGAHYTVVRGYHASDTFFGTRLNFVDIMDPGCGDCVSLLYDTAVDDGTVKWKGSRATEFVNQSYSQGTAVYQNGSVRRVYAFVRGDDKRLHVNFWDGTKWNWADQGSPGSDLTWDPSVVTYREGGTQRFYAFISGENGRLYANYWDGSNWNWADYGKPTGCGVSGQPGAIMFKRDYPDYNQGNAPRVYAFVRGTDGHLHVNYWDGTQWLWADQGTPTGTTVHSSPSVITFRAHKITQIHVYAMAENGHLCANYWDGSNWNWTDQGKPTGTTVASRPHVITYKEQDQVMIYTFVKGANGHLYVHYYNGGWAWADQGTPPGTTIAQLSPGVITYRKDNLQRIYAFVIGSNGHLYVNYWNGSIWQWADQGRPPGTLVAETQTQHAGSLTYRKGDLRKIWVFVMGTNHKVYANHWDGNSWSWKDQMP